MVRLDSAHPAALACAHRKRGRNCASTIAAALLLPLTLGVTACPADDPEPSVTAAATLQDDDAGSSDPTAPSSCSICQPACTTPADCCAVFDESIPPEVSCPDEFPYNFACPDGVCRPIGCTNDGDCAYFPGPSQICVVASGLGRCRLPCEGDADCENAGPVPGLPIMCDGVTESGERYCDAIRPPMCATPPPGTGDTGGCNVGVCPCEDDADCIDGWGCTPAW